MKKITFLFLLTGFYSFAQNFTDVTGSLPQLKKSFAAWGDYDNDGDLDLFYTGFLNNSNPGGGGLFQNNNGTFTLVSNSGLPQLETGEADWGDFNNDGNLDIIIMGYDNSTYAAKTDIYINNGNGTFTAANSGVINAYMGDVKFVDVNNDNLLDIAITGIETTNWTYFTKIYTNNGNGTVTQSNNSLPSVNYGKIKFADFDNDGDMDFVLNGWKNTNNTPYTAVWTNDGNGNFTENTTISLAQLWLGDMEWTDVDNDNDIDLFISGTPSSESEMHLYLNDGNGNFTEDPHFSSLTPVHQSNIVFADFDNDGDQDFFLMGRHYSSNAEFYASYLYINNNAVFTENTSFNFISTIYGDAEAGDYDNNGFPDLFVCGNDTNDNGAAALYQNGTASLVSDYLINEYKIYPNPATDILYIQPVQSKNFSVLITNLTGQIIYQNNINSSFVSINLKNYKPGIYLLRIDEGNQSFVSKIIIK